MVILFLVFWETALLFSTVTVPIYVPINIAQGLPLLHILAVFVICVLFGVSYSDRCDVLSYCGSHLHFPDNYQCWASFHVPVDHPHFLFGKMSIQFYLFKIRLFAFLVLNCMPCLYILDINPLLVISFAIFSPVQ